MSQNKKNVPISRICFDVYFHISGRPLGDFIWFSVLISVVDGRRFFLGLRYIFW